MLPTQQNQIRQVKAGVTMVINGKISAVSKQVLGDVSHKGDISGDVSKAENIYVKEVSFGNRYEFPSIGKDNIIYIAKDEHASYIFDSTQNTYHCIGRDYNEIGTIQCLLKEE